MEYGVCALPAPVCADRRIPPPSREARKTSSAILTVFFLDIFIRYQSQTYQHKVTNYKDGVFHFLNKINCVSTREYHDIVRLFINVGLYFK